MICVVSHPAMPKNSMACAASVALNMVVAPISLASDSRRANSSPVAPVTARTAAIA